MTVDPSSDERHGTPKFATTQWTRILAARGDSVEARDALRELCAAYYRPVEAFIERTCRSAQDARDLTHDFFVHVLDRNAFDRADRNRGRFRSYLLGAVKHFLADTNDRRMAQKRGAGNAPVSIDGPLASDQAATDRSDGLPLIDPAGFPLDAFFDRAWAIEVLQRVLDTLAEQHELAGRAAEFELLKPALTGDATVLPPTELGEKLNISPDAAAMVVHRLRKQFRAAVKAEIAATVAEPDDVRLELDYLIQALSHAADE